MKNYSDNKNPFVLYYLAYTKNKLNKKDEALQILNLLTKENPNFFEAYHLSSNIYEDLKKYNDAKNILELIIKKNPNDWKANYNLGRLCQLYLKNNTQALNCYHKALEKKQDNNDIWNALANLQKKT